MKHIFDFDFSCPKKKYFYHSNIFILSWIISNDFFFLQEKCFSLRYRAFIILTDPLKYLNMVLWMIWYRSIWKNMKKKFNKIWRKIRYLQLRSFVGQQYSFKHCIQNYTLYFITLIKFDIIGTNLNQLIFDEDTISKITSESNKSFG